MPSKQIVDALGQSGEAFEYGGDVQYWQFDPASSGVIISGTVVKMKASIASSAVQAVAIATTATPDFTFLGVAVNAPIAGYTPGQVMQVAVSGVVNVLFDANNTTFGHLALQSAATAGNATDSATATVGKTLGVVMSTQTVGAANTLVPVLLRIM
jgi:hypothetical protein